MQENYEAQVRSLEEESRKTQHKLSNQHRREIETLEQAQREQSAFERKTAETWFNKMKQVIIIIFIIIII